MIILGIGSLVSNAAAAILRDGVMLAAVEEEKLSRRSRQLTPGGLPERSIRFCLDCAGIRSEDVECVAIVRPIPASPESDLHLRLRSLFPKSRLVLIEHHIAHAAAAYFASPFQEATVLTIDRLGDYRCTARSKAKGNQILLDRESIFPDSLGELYGRVTELLGFQSSSDEHKVQWLSVNGDGSCKDLFLEILRPGPGQWPRINRSFLDADRTTRGGFSSKFFERLGLSGGGEIPEALRAPVAAGIQQAVEALALEMAGEGENLCLGGGMGMNALLVAALEQSGRYRNVFVQPAAGNMGNALGAVLWIWHRTFGQSQRPDLGSYYLGPSFGAEELKRELENCKLRFKYLLTSDEVIGTAVELIHDSKIIAWMHGRMEFGPRALGNRSILASPLDPYSTENLNTYIKHREQFRKFAASVPVEVAAQYFDVGPNARYLATVGKVKPEYRAQFASAVLANDLIRVHTVSAEDNPLYWRLLHATGKKTGLPVLYNTSFNLFGEPLVCTPRDAVRSFFASGVDALFVGNFLLQK